MICRLSPFGRCALLAALVGLSGISAGCGPDFEPAYRVINERVLAITADPPEAVPGETVTFSALVAGPEGTLLEGQDHEQTWWQCPSEDNAEDPLVDEERCTAPGAQVVLGAGDPFEDTIPLDLFPLDALADPEADPEAAIENSADNATLLGALLGYWRVLGMTMTAGDRVVDAFKRVVVFAPIPLGELDVRLNDAGEIVRNTNPTLLDVQIRLGERDGERVSAISPGGTYWLRPRYDERTLQAYKSLKVDLAGLDLDDPDALSELGEEELKKRLKKVERCEIPIFSWFVTAGTLRRGTTVDERVVEDFFADDGQTCPPVEGEIRRPEVRYTAPEGEEIPNDGVVHGWVVMRDGRGGTATHAFELYVE
jgi:hypothetical protein